MVYNASIIGSMNSQRCLRECLLPCWQKDVQQKGRCLTWLELRGRAEVHAAQVLHCAGHLLAAVLLLQQQILRLQVAINHTPAAVACMSKDNHRTRVWSLTSGPHSIHFWAPGCARGTGCGNTTDRRRAFRGVPSMHSKMHIPDGVD